MTQGNDFRGDDEPKLFSALLRPHRALSRQGFFVLMACFSVISFGAGLVLLWMGAWPVFGFFGLDVLAIYAAFKIYDRHAKATEEITVTASEIRVRRVSPRGDVVEWAFNPLWVQIDRVEHAEFGIEQLFLVSRGRRVSIARFLGAEEKASFLSALLEALGQAKRGANYHSMA